MEPLNLDSSDVGLIEAFVSKIYSKMRIGATGNCTHAQITRRVLGSEVGFDDLDYSFDIGYSAEPPDLLIICDVISNTIRSGGEGYEDTFGPGDQFLISRPGLAYGGVAHATRLRFTLLDPALLTRVAATEAADMADPVRLLDHRPISRQAALRLQRCIAHVRDNVFSDPDAAQSPLLVSTASQYLAASVLHAYPNTAVTDVSAGTRRDANPSTLSRAVIYIEANPELDIGVADIARAARVSVRALQLAFRLHLDTTPMAYLRRVRLDRARGDLLAADSGDHATVTAIAARWGFLSASRFAAYYRAAYGKLPRDTLRG